MANRYWVGGTATWDGTAGTKWATTSGGGGGAAVPTAADDVFFDAASGAVTVTVNNGVVAQSVNCTGFTGTLASSASATWTIGGTSSGGFTLDAGMTFTANSSTIVFASGGGATYAFTSAGKTFANITVNSNTTTTVQLVDGLTASGTVTLTQGRLDTNNQTCTWGSFSSVNSNTRTLTMGSSAITLTAAGVAWNTSTFTNLTVTANTSTVTLTGATSTWFGGSGFNTNGGSIVMAGSGLATVANSFTCANLTRTGTASKTDGLQFNGGSTTVTGTLTITGNSAVNRVLATSLTHGTGTSVSAGAVSLTNVDFRDINAGGAAIPFTGSLVGDCGGNNANITFTTPATQTWQGTAGGNWSDVSKWTSRVPLPQDDVVIASAFSASQTITADMPRLGKNIDWVGCSGSPTWSITQTTVIFGSVNISDIGSVTSTGVSTFFSGRGSHTITTGGKNFALYGQINAGTYTLTDNLTMNNLVVAGYSGTTFTTNNFNVTISNFQINNGNTVNMGSGTWTLNGTLATPNALWNCTGGSATINAGTSTIIISTASSNSRTFAGAGKTYNNLTYTVAGSTGNLIISGSNTFNTLSFSDITNARTLQLTSGTTTTITGAFNVNGTAGKLMTVNASTPGSAATLSKSSGAISCDYLSIQDSAAGGGATWYAGVNSTDVSGNSGWIFTGSSDNFLQLF